MPWSREQKHTFNEVADVYEEMRPGYPAQLFADTFALTALPENGRILEIGCGTGKATLPFAQRGYTMLCVDIGPQLLALTAEKCRAFPNVKLACVPFEDWLPGGQRFDLVISASAFHWLPPETSYVKAASVLKSGGSIALFWNMQPPLSDARLADAIQAAYRKCAPGIARGDDALSIGERNKRREDELNGCGSFEPATVKQYPWECTYTTAQYTRLLNTYSDHRSLPADVRGKLEAEVAAVIDRFGGRITKPLLSVLYVARKKRD